MIRFALSLFCSHCIRFHHFIFTPLLCGVVWRCWRLCNQLLSWKCSIKIDFVHTMIRFDSLRVFFFVRDNFFVGKCTQNDFQFSVFFCFLSVIFSLSIDFFFVILDDFFYFHHSYEVVMIHWIAALYLVWPFMHASPNWNSFPLIWVKRFLHTFV